VVVSASSSLQTEGGIPGYRDVATASRRHLLEAIEEYDIRLQRELDQLERENEHLRVQLARVSAELALLRIAQREQGLGADIVESGTGVGLRQRIDAKSSLFRFWRWVIGREFHEAEWQQHDHDTQHPS
jgi:hypothetical protein